MSTIRRCEWEKLTVGEEGFGPREFKALSRINEASGHKFFTLSHNAILFRQFVGVIRVGRITIEVLPKVTRGGGEKGEREKWQTALIAMLRFAPRLRMHSPTRAPLSTHATSLSDWLVRWFLDEVEHLLARGLAKTYQEYEENERFFKGQLVVSSHLAHNLVHRERSFVAYSRYDYSHAANRGINQALAILAKTGISPLQSTRIKALREVLPPETAKPLKAPEWGRIRFNRKTAHYKTPFELARLICMSYFPGLRSGLDDTFALLFDMQELFETYIGALMRRALREDPARKVGLQQMLRFWNGAGGNMRADILVKGGGPETDVVIDTKWKIRPEKPDPHDLRQVYVYGQYADAKRVILLYPALEAGEKPVDNGFFDTPLVQRHKGLAQIPMTCSLATVDLFNGKGSIDEAHITEQLRALAEPRLMT